MKTNHPEELYSSYSLGSMACSFNDTSCSTKGIPTPEVVGEGPGSNSSNAGLFAAFSFATNITTRLTTNITVNRGIPTPEVVGKGPASFNHCAGSLPFNHQIELTDSCSFTETSCSTKGIPTPEVVGEGPG